MEIVSLLTVYWGVVAEKAHDFRLWVVSHEKTNRPALIILPPYRYSSM